MSQLGERLRAVRESQGISISQASIETRILQRYLVALEDGDYQHLPGDVYARGFIRNYANYLGISAEELMELYRRERGVSEPIRVVPATSPPRIRGFFIPSFFGVFFVVLALVGISYLALSLTNRIGEGTPLAEVEPTQTAAPPPPLPTNEPEPTADILASGPSNEPGAANTPIAGAVATPVLPQTPTPQATPEPDAPIVGEVRIADGQNPGSWMSITLDGNTVFEGILAPGASYPFTAESIYRIRAGNAGVVFVVVNGQEFGPLGGDGQVVDWPPR